MSEKKFYFYMLANKKRGFLYHGISSDLVPRTWKHKNSFYEGHTDKYNIKRLVYYEVYDNFEAAVTREKRVKRWRRKWKEELIETMNPDWNDLYRIVAG